MSSVIESKNILILVLIGTIAGGGALYGTSSSNVTQDKIQAIEKDIEDLEKNLHDLEKSLNDHKSQAAHPAAIEKLKSLEDRTAAMEQNIIDKLLAELIEVIGGAVSSP